MERTLYFHYNGLSQNVNLMLCFNPPVGSQLGQFQNLVAWRVIAARKGVQNGTATATYFTRYGFGETELDNGNQILGSIVVEMREGQSVDLLTDSDDQPIWDAPRNNPDVGKLIRATNRTDLSRTMSVGTIKGNGTTFEYQATFLWTTVGPSLFVEAEFTPTLQCFVNLGYQENEFIRADIMSDSIATIELDGLPASSHFDLIETPQHGYVIQMRGNASLRGVNLPSIPWIAQDADNGLEIESGLGGILEIPDVPNVKFRPEINLSYSFKVHWTQRISKEFVSSNFAALERALRDADVLYTDYAQDEQYFRILTTSKPGTTCAALKDTVAKLIARKLSSDFRVDSDSFWNISSPQPLPGSVEVKEYIAPESLAYYYVQQRL